MTVYWRDPIQCLQALFHNPLVADHLDMTPFREFKTAEKLVRVYTEWMSGDAAWEMQVSPKQAVPIYYSHIISRTKFLKALPSLLQFYLQIKQTYQL